MGRGCTRTNLCKGHEPAKSFRALTPPSMLQFRADGAYSIVWSVPGLGLSRMMEELHIDRIDGGHEPAMGLGHVPGRGRAPTWFKKDTTRFTN
jgi:hypothetical protein